MGGEGKQPLRRVTTLDTPMLEANAGNIRTTSIRTCGIPVHVQI